MDRKIATIVGATAVLATAPVATQAAAPPTAPAVPVAANYAELLEPIPNAVERLKIADAEDAARLEKVQFTLQFGDRHDHHHHHHSRDWYLSNGYVYLGGRWVTRDYYNHHHHHHHHHHHSHDY
ncbi:MAG TPA: hypothetical protein VKB67_12275 [Rhizomicrobium sp.]|nr:hypothetical protein [Rhizomicrobium sp.]